MQALEHQADAITEIAARARAFFAGEWKGLSIKPRWHSLLVGQTGTGKTAVAEMAAKAVTAGTIGAAGTASTILRCSSPGWVPAGAHQRGTKETISVIAAAVAANARTFLIIDEIEKLVDRVGDNGWKTYIRGEIYDLLDGRWPTGLRRPDDDSDDDSIDDAKAMAILTEKLQSSVFILGIGTFQDWFERAPSRRSMGFGANDQEETISADVVAGLMPRELANRFNSQLIMLRDLDARHYHMIAQQAENTLPERLRLAFRTEVDRRIHPAISAQKGVRFLEECLMEVLKNRPLEGLEITIPKPTKDPGINLLTELCSL